MSTAVKNPFAVSRQVTGRVQIKQSSAGKLFILDADGQGLHEARLAVGQTATASFTMSSTDNCGSVVIQPLAWGIHGCLAEISHVLGSVDFPYLTGSPYRSWPQNERVKTVEVKFTRTADTLGKIETKIGSHGGFYKTECDILPSAAAAEAGREDGLTALFVTFTEKGLPSGGQLVVTGLKDAAGDPTTLTYDLP